MNFGNIFKDINRTFRIEMDTRFVSFDRLTLNDTVNKVNTNSLLRDVITGNSRDVLMSELQKKGYQKADVNDKIKELEGKIVGM